MMTRTLPVAVTVILISMWQLQADAAPEALIHEWLAEELTSGGKVVGCQIIVDGMVSTSLYVSANVALLAEAAGRLGIYTRTMVKITSAEIDVERAIKTPIPLFGGWIRTSSGTTVGNLKTLPTGPHYLGISPGADLFVKLLEGVLEQGVTVGFQQRVGGLDTTVAFPAPPADVLVKLNSCLKSLEETVLR